MDIVSSNGYAYGYAGSCIPFIISLIFVLGYNKIGISLSAAMLISFVNSSFMVVLNDSSAY